MSPEVFFLSSVVKSDKDQRQALEMMTLVYFSFRSTYSLCLFLLGLLLQAFVNLHLVYFAFLLGSRNTFVFSIVMIVAIGTPPRNI